MASIAAKARPRPSGCSSLARELMAVGAPTDRGRRRSPTRSARPRYLEGDFVLRSGKRSSVLPRQVPLRHAARPAQAARRGDRRGRRRARARGACGSRRPSSAPCRSRPRPRSSRAAVRDRARRGEGLRHRQPHRGRLRAGRVRLPRRGRRHLRRRGASRPSRRCARPASASRNAVCVVDREEGGVDGARPARPCGCGRSSRTASELRAGKHVPQGRMVERYPTPLLGFRPTEFRPWHPARLRRKALTKQEFIQTGRREERLRPATRTRPSTPSWRP